MKYENLLKGTEIDEMSLKDLLEILHAVSQIYPLIVLANLTKNSYVMLKDEDFLFERLAGSTYDEMIQNGSKHIHESYKQFFFECFGRMNLLRRFERGERTISAKLYQKNTDGNYHWVSTKVVRIEDESGDILHLCLNEVLPTEDVPSHMTRYGSSGS